MATDLSVWVSSAVDETGAVTSTEKKLIAEEGVLECDYYAFISA